MNNNIVQPINIVKNILIACLLTIFPIVGFGITYEITSPGNNVFGSTEQTTVHVGQTITEIGQKHEVGYLEFVEANPKINIDRLYDGQVLVLPKKLTLPDAPRQGIVINVAELRLFYFRPGTNKVYVYPVGIGRENTETPIITSQIVEKKVDPTWTPTPETRKEALEMGIIMATVTPAGPDNPLGKYMMRLAKRTYLIHSTNAPWGVGRRSSGGCIRMYPSSIEALFGMVPVGTQVRIINDPVKTGWESSHLYLESHVPVDFKTRRAHEMIPLASTVVRKELLNKNVDINWNTFVQVARAQQGIPQDIGVAY